MKTFQYSMGKFLLIVIACSFFAGAMAKAGGLSPTIYVPRNSALGGNAGLFVWRAADFGTDIYLRLYIDGIPVTTLARNEAYEAIVRPGRHVLSIATGPFGQQDKTRLFNRHVNMRRGQTYSFTALWIEADLATLETPDHALSSLR